MKGDNLPEILSMVSLCFLWVGFVCGVGGWGGCLVGWFCCCFWLVGGLAGYCFVVVVVSVVVDFRYK